MYLCKSLNVVFYINYISKHNIIIDYYSIIIISTYSIKSMIGIIQRLNANVLCLFYAHLYLVRFCQSKPKEITSIVISSRPWVLNVSNCQAERRTCTNYSYIKI